MNTLDVSRWLWDFYFSGTLLLSGALLACLFARQPARRVALAWATAVGLLALALLTTLPNWSRWHLSAPTPLAPEWTEDLQPVSGQAIQQTPVIAPAPAQGLPPGVFPAATQNVVINWGVIAFYALAAGSAVVVTWLALGAWQVRRLRSSAKPAPSEILQLFKQLAETSDEKIQLGVLDNLPVAVAVGLSKPGILLPQTLVAQANRAQLRSVLAHELAHVEHRDLWLLALLRTLMVLLWPHPLFWFLRRRVRLDQEILADAAAAELTSRGEYAEQLVTLARTATQVRVPRLASSVGLWETRAQLKERITLLLDEKLTILRSCSRKWRVGTFVALVGVALGLSLVTLTPAEPQAQLEGATEGTEKSEAQGSPQTEVTEDKNWQKMQTMTKPVFDSRRPNTIVGLCYDESNNPLSGVNIEVYAAPFRGPKSEPQKILETTSDAEGKFQFKNVIDIAQEFPEGLPDDNFLPDNARVVTIIGRAPGRVPGNAGNDLTSRIAREGLATFLRMPPAQTLRGRIVDEKNQAVAGALVTVLQVALVPGVPEDINSALTDANGEFVIDDLDSYDIEQAEKNFVESQKGAWVTFSGTSQPWERFLNVKYPDFAAKRVKITEIPGRLETTLSPGAVLTGRVVTQEANKDPQSGASVEITLQRHGSPDKPQEFAHQVLKAATDAKGTYRFESLPGGEYSVIANMNGWVSMGIENVEVPVGENATAPDLVMTRGGRVRIQLVNDENGKPLTFGEPTKAYINPSPRPRKTLYSIPVSSNIVEFTPGGVGEIQVPAGRFAFSGAIPGKQPEPGWKVADFMRVKTVEDLDKVSAHDVAEGEVKEIELRMVRDEPKVDGEIKFTPTAPISEPAEGEPMEKPTDTFVPATEPAEKADKDAYENGIFVPDPPVSRF